MLILNGVLMGESEATLPATDRALTHGLGLYETIKLAEGVPVFFEEHVARLVQGIAALGLEKDIDKPELAEQICRLSEANGGGDNSCRLLVTAGPPDGAPSLLVQTDRRDFPDRPLRVVSYRGVRVSAQYKAMTVMQSYFAQRAARAAGVDDALLVDGEGRVFEGATSNVFVVRGGGLITPPAEGDILPACSAPRSRSSRRARASPSWRRGRASPTCARTTGCCSRAVSAASCRWSASTTCGCWSTSGNYAAARARRRRRGRERLGLPRDLPLGGAPLRRLAARRGDLPVPRVTSMAVRGINGSCNASSPSSSLPRSS